LLFRAHPPTQCYFHVPDRRVDFLFQLVDQRQQMHYPLCHGARYS